MNETITTILNRKSVRHYKKDEVPAETLELLIRCGMAAPSARNTQPWEFIAVNNRETLDRLADGLPYAKMQFDAGSSIIVCGDLNNEAGKTHWIEDCSAAIQNILLATESLGLGAVWTAAYPDSARNTTVKTILGLPEHIIPLAVIPIGYPADGDNVKDKFNASRIHWDKW